jgi:hypothetical protein
MEDVRSESDTDRPGPGRVGHHHFHLSLTRPSHLLSTVLLLAATALVAWTVFLGFTLPPKYDAGHWNLVWTGFDVGLFLILGYAAWAAWFRRQILATTAIVAGTLLLCDAWFDIITSIGHRDQWLTLLTGCAGELPLALFFFWLYRRIVMNTLAAFHQRLGVEAPPRRLRDVEILRLSTRPEESDRQPVPSGRDDRPGSDPPVVSRCPTVPASASTPVMAHRARADGAIGGVRPA